MTAVRLQTGHIILSVAFGAPAKLRNSRHGKLALFGPNKIVAYVARHPPVQALYLFRTSPANDVGVRLRNVSHPVDLLYVASTYRTVRKVTLALDAIADRIGAAGLDALPDVFWLRLADVIERRGRQVIYYVAHMLAEQSLPL
jgi:hypothetical protein